MNTPVASTHKHAATVLTAAILLVGLTCSCASGSPKASSTTSLPGHTRAQLFQRATRALVSGGFEVKSKDESAGTIQALRPMKGSMAKPGYGNNITILVNDGSVDVTVFKAEGVIAAHSVEEIRDEIVKLIQEQK